MIGRDTIIEFIESHVNLVIGITAVVLISLVTVFIIAVRADSGKKKAAAALEAERAALAIHIDDLWLPPFPLESPEFLYTRERKSHWSADDVKRWYTVPDDALMEEFGERVRAQVEDILQGVP